jgi:hypothetical protein
MIDDMREIESLSRVRGRVTVRIGDVFLKIDTHPSAHRRRGRAHGEGTDVGAWFRTARRDQRSETVIDPSSR